MHKVHKINYSNYIGTTMKIYVATMKVLRKKDKQDETQFTPITMCLMPYYTQTGLSCPLIDQLYGKF
jgi:hypothetical protein